MKTLINNHASYLGILFLVTIFLSTFGCETSKTLWAKCWFSGEAASNPAPDPLAGWTFLSFPGWGLHPDNTNHLDKVIVDDYQDFIGNEHLDLFGAITGFFEDGTGRHAIEFQAFSPGQNATWNYVLIYDKENKRVKVIKYGYRKFQS